MPAVSDTYGRNAVAGLGPTPDDWLTRFARAMDDATAMYADAIRTVQNIVGNAHMTQLGGMCLAIEARLEGGWLWITDVNDNLPWDRDDQEGWTVSWHVGDLDGDESQPPQRTASVEDTSGEALRDLLANVLLPDR